MLFAQTVTYTTDTTTSAGAGIGILIVQLVVGLVVLAFSIWCIIDVTKHSDQAFEAAGTPKQTALIITIVGLLCCVLANLYYWFAIRPKVIAAEQGGAGGYTPPPAV